MRTAIAVVTFTVVILAALCACACVHASSVSASTLRGVMTEMIPKYEAAIKADGTFTCFDGSKTIAATKLNDEYCDCADGSDEPGSSACSFDPANRLPAKWRFQCTNAGHKPQLFFHSRVNDGICDCCDGSDEYLYSATTCANVCATWSAKREEEEAAREAHRQAGLDARTALLEKGAKQREAWQAELAAAEAGAAALKEELAAAEAEVALHEAVETAKRKEIHEKSLQEKAVWDAEQQQKREAEEEAEAATKKTKQQEEEAAQQPQPTKDAASDTVGGIQNEAHGTPSGEIPMQTDDSEPRSIICLGWRQTKDCSGSGEREPVADRDCASRIDGGQSGFCECKVDGNDETYPFDCGHRPLVCEKVCRMRGSDESFEDAAPEPDVTQPPQEPPAPPQFTVDDGSSFNLPEALEARRKRDEAKLKLQGNEQTVSDVKANLEKDYGADHVFLGLANECFEKRAGEFTYKICPMKETFQDSTSLGKFKSWAKQTYGSWGGGEDHTKQEYRDGTNCWGGPARSCDVILVCGPENIIKSVEEPSMCAYKMVFQTPAICE